jgi:RimJ/RimL family protein N-acetyltransferase
VSYARRGLGLRRLIFLILPGNATSMRVAEKVGMSFAREVELENVRCLVYSGDLAAVLA